MRMDVSLQMSVNEPAPPKKGKKKAKAPEEDPVKQVMAFLTQWDTAKIVVVVETHCIESGKFIWTGDEPVNYESCWLEEVGVRGLSCIMLLM